MLTAGLAPPRSKTNPWSGMALTCSPMDGSGSVFLVCMNAAAEEARRAMPRKETKRVIVRVWELVAGRECGCLSRDWRDRWSYGTLGLYSLSAEVLGSTDYM